MTAPLSPDVLAGLAGLAETWHRRGRLPLRRGARTIDGADGEEIAACRSALVASDVAAAVNALPGLLATVAARDREIAALRERLALTEARTAVPPPREALPGLRALAASEAAAEVLEDVARCECCERGDPCEIGPSGARCCGCCMGTGVA